MKARHSNLGRLGLAIAIALSIEVFASTQALADDVEESTTKTATENDSDKQKSIASLSEEKTAELRAKGLKDQEIARIAKLADLSGKSVDDVAALRLADRKRGWGVIAKDLGLHPSVLGNGVGPDEDRMQERVERKQERAERRAERKEERKQRKADLGKAKN